MMLAELTVTKDSMPAESNIEDLLTVTNDSMPCESDCTEHLLDLPDELVSKCAAQCDAATLLRLAATCRTCLRIVVKDKDAAAITWTNAARDASEARRRPRRSFEV